ncbi:MAG: S1 RNA-binding domain-containing protein [bacterium]
MPSEIGSIVEGKITKITNFGAFVQLADGSQGLIHISQIANQFVKDISEHLKINDVVKVKVLAMNEKGCFDLSLKDAQDDPESSKKKIDLFEEKLARFLKSSDERLSDLRRNMEAKRGGGGRIKY